MKRFLAHILLALVSVVAAAGQQTSSNALKFTGNVVSVEAVCRNGKLLSQVSLYLQFRNDGDKPLLFLVPARPYFDVRIKFAPEGAESSQISADILTYNPYNFNDPLGPRPPDYYDPMPQYVDILKRAKAPPKMVEPGGYYEFRDMFWSKSGFELRAQGANDEVLNCKPDKVYPVPQYPHFTVEYYLSVKDQEGGEGLLQRLQDRWKALGYFPLNDKGDVSYKSEKILLSATNK